MEIKSFQYVRVCKLTLLFWQAVQWIRKKEANQNLKIVTFSDTDFLKHLEMAINCGYPILFEDVDDFIDPVIENVLDSDIKGEKFCR
jgi:dynein heavy chain